MKKQIMLQNKKVSYTLRINKRARSLKLAVYRGGEFVVIAPQNIGATIIEKFIKQKSKWILDKIDFLGKFPKDLNARGRKAEYLKYKEVARELVERKVLEFNKIYKFKYNRISIKNQKTRWGSCSTKGNLNFNYKIALLPEKMADYIVVHELCHLYEFNHSQNFWKLVEKTVPDYKEIRKELKKSNLRFH